MLIWPKNVGKSALLASFISASGCGALIDRQFLLIRVHSIGEQTLAE